jgi:hypothetical protein
MHIFISFNGPDGTYHDAGPTADAFFQVDCDAAGFLVFANTARNAGQSAGRFFTMPALDCDCPNPVKHPFLINRFHMNSWAAWRMRRSACQFTGSARETFFYFAKDSFHNSYRFF